MRKAPPRAIATASSLTRRWTLSRMRACSPSPCRRPTAAPACSARTVARVIAALSRADGSIGQIPQNHFFMLEGLRLQGTEEQKRFFYGRVLAGERLGNALSETGTKTAHDHATRLTRDGAIYRLNGRKFYSTGVLFAHWVAVVANDENDVSTIAFVPRDTKGITIIDDSSGFGQRTTGSGTTLLDNVEVRPFGILFAALSTSASMGPFAQIMHAAVEQGIAEAALADTVRSSATPLVPPRMPASTGPATTPIQSRSPAN